MNKTAIAAALGSKSKASYPDAVQSGHVERKPATGQATLYGNVEGNFPAGVYKDSINQAVAPFAGNHQLPTGQSINVSMNAPSPHLTFKEWAARGVVAGIGHAAAWPFKLVSGIVDSIAKMIVNLLGKLALFVLLPTMLLIGFKMAMQMSEAETVEQGAEQMVFHGRHAADGIVSGFSKDLPPEEKKNPEK